MWNPEISSAASPLYRRLADAIEADVGCGILGPDTRLPPQRELAHALGISVGTVTRAYEEAERRGLIVAHVGRGSFVAKDDPAAASSLDGPFDLATNIAPTAAAVNAFDDAIKYLGRRPNRTPHGSYVSRFGADNARIAGATWLASQAHLPEPDWNRIVCTNGAQHAISLTLETLAAKGDTILCEDQTYIGIKAIAAARGYLLRGIAMDSEGLCPEAFEKAAKETGARILYVLPTLQNPTARVMSNARRAQVARIARKYDLQVIEDDVYAHFARALAPVPIASLIPERCWYIGGLSKAVSPSLRAGYLLVPVGMMLDRVGSIIQATTLTPPSFTFDIATQLIESGAAREIVADVIFETESRAKLAKRILGPNIEPPSCQASVHVWMPLSALEAESTAGRALRAGVSVMSPASPSVGNTTETGLRLALGSAPTQEHLEVALSRLLACRRQEWGEISSDLV